MAAGRRVLSTRPLIREAALKLDERTGKVGHGGRSHSGVRYSFYAVRFKELILLDYDP